MIPPSLPETICTDAEPSAAASLHNSEPTQTDAGGTQRQSETSRRKNQLISTSQNCNACRKR